MAFHSISFTGLKPFLLCGTALFAASGIIYGASSDSAASGWAIAGQDLENTRSAPNEHQINAANVASLKVKWYFVTQQGDVSATPTVSSDAVYFPDSAGYLYSIAKNDGTLLWSHKISDYDNYPGAVSRVSPAIHGDDLILGDIESSGKPHNGASIMAVNRQTGIMHWITRVSNHPAAIITGSPVFVGDIAYVGVSSSEESLATDASYPCCSFRGSIVALNANTGQILWQTFTMPDNQGKVDGYSGGAVWQQPAIDVARGSLYIGTGNNYEIPESVKTCLAAANLASQTNCFDATDYFDTALALDLATGTVKWAKRLQGFDVWTVACVRNPSPMSCPYPSSPDFDLSGSGPNLLPNIVGFGQKSGIYWALNPDNGNIVWSTVAGPGGTLGGIEWGTATDGQRIYLAVTNSAHKNYPLVSGNAITWGAWSALDAATGKIVWQTADPSQSLTMGAVTVANGVVFAPSLSENMHALDAKTGQILWTFPSGGSVLDGPSVVDGTVFWGSGYRKTAPGTANNRIYAFTLTTPEQ